MTIARRFLAALLVAIPVFAQAQSAAERRYSQAELDQMLAPVALYPDSLLSQLLMAATYPVEVSEAARWSRDHPGLQGEDAVRAAQDRDWDPSVQSLVAFPQVLARMAENPLWMQSLGDAFLMQEAQLMDTVQQLRRRARAAGSLQSSEQLEVREQGRTIVLQPASPQFVYVPYYDPMVVYGTWWWPAYRPVAWTPWAGYARPYYRPGIATALWWGTPVVTPANFFFGNCDWGRRQVRVVRPTAYYYRGYRPPLAANQTVAVLPHRWQREPPRREAVAVPQQVVLRQPVAPAPRTLVPQVPAPRAQIPPSPARGAPRNERAPRGRERS